MASLSAIYGITMLGGSMAAMASAFMAEQVNPVNNPTMEELPLQSGGVQAKYLNNPEYLLTKIKDAIERMKVNKNALSTLTDKTIKKINGLVTNLFTDDEVIDECHWH